MVRACAASSASDEARKIPFRADCHVRSKKLRDASDRSFGAGEDLEMQVRRAARIAAGQHDDKADPAQAAADRDAAQVVAIGCVVD